MFEKLLEFAVGDSRDVRAPADAVWEDILSFDSIPDRYRSIYSVKRIDGSRPGDKVRVGSRFRMGILLEMGEKFESECVVTRLEEDSDGKRRITTFWPKMAHNATASRTAMVEPLPSHYDSSPEDACRVTITMALVPHRFFAIVGRVMCCCVFRRRALKSIESDLEDFERPYVGEGKRSEEPDASQASSSHHRRISPVA